MVARTVTVAGVNREEPKMSEFSRMAKIILRMTFPVRHYDRSGLARLLAQHCTDEAAFEAVESAILLNLSEGPWPLLHHNDGGRWVPVVPQAVLAELVNATTTEVFRLLKGVCEEIASASLRFESRTLYVKGREVASWRDQGEDNRPQIDLLTAFQDAKWPCSIPNPLPEKQHHDDLGQVLRNLNRKLRQWLHFNQRNGRIYWRWA